MADLQKSRNKQNIAFAGALVLAVAIALSTNAVAWVVNAQHEGSSDGQSKEYLTVTIDEVSEAYVIFANESKGVERKIDVTAQLSAIAAVNGGTVDGIDTSAISLAETGVDQKNETKENAVGKLVLYLKNGTSQKFIDGIVTGYTYSFRAVASGAYLANAADPNSTTVYHKDTAKDFRISAGFAQGDSKLFVSPLMNIDDGSKVGDNYTRAGGIGIIPLAQARVDGLDSLKDYDNQVVITIDGFKTGNGGEASDLVIFSVQFTAPNAPGAWTWEEGYGIGGLLGGIALALGGALASPIVSLNGIELTDRKFGGRRP